MQIKSKDEKPKCSVCIANFNGEFVIEACIESILNQQNKIPTEIIIFDDASTDQSTALIQEKYPFVILIKSDSNVGFCVANNRMAAIAQGEYLLFLNNDATLFSDAIDTLFTAAMASKNYTIYGLPQYSTNTHELIDCGAFLDPFFYAVPNKVLQQQEVAMVAGACLWIPKALWDELGGFPEFFGSIAEDLFLCCYARLAGYSVIALATSGFYHMVGYSFGGGKVSNNQLSSTFKRRALSERNKLFVALMITPILWRFCILPIQITLLLIEGMLLAIYRRQWQIWKTIYARLIPDLYLYRASWKVVRQKVQSSRRISFRKWLSVMQWKFYKIQMVIKYGVPTIK